LGIPCSGQHSRAETNASCAKSSAKSISRTRRTRPPIKRAASSFHTASIERRTWSATGIAKPHNSARRLAPLATVSTLDFLLQAFLLLTQLRSEFFSKVFRLKDWAQLDFTPLEWGPPDPLECLIHRLDLPYPI